MPSEKTIVFSLFNRFRLKLLVSRHMYLEGGLPSLRASVHSRMMVSLGIVFKCQNYK